MSMPYYDTDTPEEKKAKDVYGKAYTNYSLGKPSTEGMTPEEIGIYNSWDFTTNPPKTASKASN